MFAFSGRLLSAEELREQLAEALSTAEGQVSLGSAYLKTPALNWAATHLRRDAPVRVLTRWQPGDLLSGSSDVEAYEVASANGWRFFTQEDFHGKVYLVDRRALFVGSANLTSRGLNLYGVGNDEINVRADLSVANYAFVDRIFQRAVAVDQKICTAIKRWLYANKDRFQKEDNPAWPKELAELLKPLNPPDRLFVAECFHTNGVWALQMRDVPDQERVAIERDMSLLGLALEERVGAMYSPLFIAKRLRETKMYAWLYERLRSAEGQELYFGALTAALHDCLLDDPAPFRSEVKILLANLLGWIDLSRMPEIQVDRPNYAQRVVLRTPVE